MQEQSIHPSFHRLTTLLAVIVTSFAGLLSTELKAKDIGILMDRSRSVEQINRDEAVALVNGLLSGQVNPEIRKKWKLIEDGTAEDDPVQREVRKEELANLGALLSGQPGKGLGTGNFRLFLGSFGNLDTVKKLEVEPLADVSGTVGDKITSWAKTVEPTDNETHFELARATAAAKLGNTREFYFFVITDGVEDLVNWPVSSYLDASKLKSAPALEKGDFRNSAKARVLELNNLERKGGKTLTIGGKTYPGYGKDEQATLAAFKKNFAERLLGRITLSGPELQAFFSANPEKKVPVSVWIYSARPRGAVTAKFTAPADSQPGQPHPVSRSSDGLAWSLEVPKGDSAEGYAQEIFVRRVSDGADVGRKAVTGFSGSVFQLFPDLPNGDYEIRLTASKTGVPPAVTSAFINVKRDAPKLAFTGDLAEAQDRPTARVFDPRRDRDILAYKVQWTWTGEDGAEIGPPAKLERVLSFIDDQDSTRKLETVVKLPPGEKSALLGSLLVGEDAGEGALPLGGTYRLTLRATWPDGSVATPARAWFVLPPPNLLILGAGGKETEEAPREIEKGDVIKIGNWMDGWTKHGFCYELDVYRKEGPEWVSLEGSPASWPLRLEKSDSGSTIRVADGFSGTLKYRVSFGPADPEARELVESPDAAGFVQGGGISFIPWIIGGLVLLTGLFFGINLFKKR